MAELIRVFHVDPHPVVRMGFFTHAAQEFDMRVVCQAADAATARSLLESAHADVVVLGIDVPALRCFALINTVHSEFPAVRTLIFSSLVAERYIALAVDAKVDGYVTIGQRWPVVAAAIRRVAGGYRYFSGDIRARLHFNGGMSRWPTEVKTRMATLSPREQEIVRLLALGRSVRQVGDDLRVSPKTVDNHKTRLMAKLGVHDRVELARLAIREGLVSA